MRFWSANGLWWKVILENVFKVSNSKVFMSSQGNGRRDQKRLISKFLSTNFSSFKEFFVWCWLNHIWNEVIMQHSTNWLWLQEINLTRSLCSMSPYHVIIYLYFFMWLDSVNSLRIEYNYLNGFEIGSTKFQVSSLAQSDGRQIDAPESLDWSLGCWFLDDGREISIKIYCLKLLGTDGTPTSRQD